MANSVRILHTADWHLGKRLYRHELLDDHELFLDWLIDIVEQRQIDVLLVAGDVFDSTNPNDGSMQLYYQFLTRLMPLNCQVIITGGNHDSSSKLNAPRDLLRHLNIHVVGCASGDCLQEVIHFHHNSTDLIIGAVPFLRDGDLRRSIAGQSYDDRIDAIRMGIRTHYGKLADHCNELYKGVPVLAMGHLYVHGASVSESEREIHAVGGQAAFASEHFPAGFDYVALGHIHVPQRVGSGDSIRYSGSPIPLSFGERDNQHQVLEVLFEDGALTSIDPILVPRFRTLRQVTGTLDDVREKLSALEPAGTLPMLVEILVEEERESLATRIHFEQLPRDFTEAPFHIAKARLTFRNKLQGLDSLYAIDTQLQDLSYLDVFDRRLEASTIDDSLRATLIDTYKELYQLVEH
ncbi:exonuclease subunit SbcD [uncultured Spirosoma sp.]|uniref:exonuclease subunit SbcD n=1 Tax=uncultured Spirosoma sp. TaxID=278208 RepID=UPI00258D73C6|nr:exonuclease subunit SbcD [uncultured Spirosoma sp.]